MSSVISPEKVVTPAIETLSRLVCPSTSISPFKSILPSITTSALTSKFPLNVEIPDTSSLFTLN